MPGLSSMKRAPTAWIVRASQNASIGMHSTIWRQERNRVRRATSQRAMPQSAHAAITRSGCLPVNAVVTMPPIDVPCTSTRSSPRASSSSAPSSAQPSTL